MADGFADTKLGERLSAVDEWFSKGKGPRSSSGGSAAEGRSDRWTYYTAREGDTEIRTAPFGSAAGKFGQILGKIAYAGEGPQSRVQYRTSDGRWEDVPEEWEPGLDPETLEPIGGGIADRMLPGKPIMGGEDETLKMFLGEDEY